LPRHLTFAVPGSLDTPTGGYLYDKHIIAGLRAGGWSVEVLDLGGEFPLPDPAAKNRAFRTLCADTSIAPIVIDGLALGALPEAAGHIAALRPLVALVHHPLFLEKGHSPETRQNLFESEKSALSKAGRIITTSGITRNRVAADFSYPLDRITAVEPGIARPARQAPIRDDASTAILSVGSLIPRKGHASLIKSLAGLRHLPWSLRIVGSPDLDRTHSADLIRLVSSLDLDAKVVFTGSITDAELSALFLSSDLFALASEYEGYGIAYAEAILHGLPVIGTTGGAIIDTVPPGTGILVDPGDDQGLSGALNLLLSDPARRRTMAACARRSGSHFQTWETAADRFASVFEDF
jgi:glycosyltransferase involved in cell wall biosynthesis